MRSTPDGDVTVLAGGTRGYRDGRGSEAQFSGIEGMASASDGSLYVTDGVYVRRVSLDGVVTTLGRGALTSSSWDEDLMGLAVSPSGSVYVADYSQRRVLQLLPDGNTRTILETGSFWSPTGITLRMPLVILGDIGIGAYARVRRVSPVGGVERIATVWDVVELLVLLARLCYRLIVACRQN